MAQFQISSDHFRKMEDPVNQKGKRIRYVFYANAKSIPKEFEDWMATNPREQKMTTNVARAIAQSLDENNNFHELNRGILMSAKKVDFCSQEKKVTITMDDPTVHGNIDGGHTLRAILDAKSSGRLSDQRYVFFEIFVGLESPVELAAARNTSVQVDLKSIEELKESFDVIKEVLKGLSFADRVAYKMNEHYNDKDVPAPIDVREIIAILNMFNQAIYQIISNGRLTETHPIQSYTGKETSLRRFLDLNSNNPNQREVILKNMHGIVADIFELWDLVECNFSVMANRANKRYGTRKYSKHDNGNVVGKSTFEQKDLEYIVPKGLLYPLVGAFRALVQLDDNDKYSWKMPPKEVWEKIGPQLTSIILDEKIDSPDGIAKNSNLWSNLFKEVYIYGHISNA